jgi:oxygen-dependent protoporphyrinogen oxidase
VRSDGAPDVLIVGAGIAGLAAALRLADGGLRPLVLEENARVGGRMTTDRVNGFAIDTGVTLLGNRFHGMRALARRLSLPTAPAPFSLGIRDERGERRYRAQRPFDLLGDPHLSLAARWASVRVLVDILRGGSAMLHGRSDRAGAREDESLGAYMSRLGAGGEELLARVFEPGLRAALGGAPRSSSRFAFLQVLWNTLGAGFWNVAGGVDRIPEALALRVPVELDARVDLVRVAASGVEVDVSSAGSRRTLHARAAILAVPADRIPSLYPDAPEWISRAAGQARYSRVASAHVALSRPPDCPHAGYAFATGDADGIGVLELEHLRAEGRCPPGKGMVSVYFVDTPTFRCLETDDATLRARALSVVEQAFPGSAETAEFTHLIRWPTGIAMFPKGRLAELTGLRARLAAWDAPLDLAGDWLDGVACESALQTGLQAADRIAARLAH